MSKKQIFVIIDGNALIHRAWHAIPPLTTKDGRLVNAAFGFTSILLKAMKDLKPDYLVATFDLAGPTFRHEQYTEYKATRVKQADELYEQFPMIKDIVRAFNIPIFEKQGFEADDVIGTLCESKHVNRDDVLSIIVTGDKDTLQLVDKNTQVFTLKKGMSETVIYDEAAVKEAFGGLTPAQMIDYKSLCGDPSDNIPGVPGIGPKTAIELLLKYKTLDGLYDAVDHDIAAGVKPRVLALLKEHKKSAYMSKDLSTIRRDVAVDFSLDECAVKPYDKEKVMQLFTDLEFRSLFNRLPEAPVEHIDQPATLEHGVTYTLVNTDEAFKSFLKELQKQEQFVFDTETTSLDVMSAELLGISFCWEKGKAYYIQTPKPPEGGFSERLAALKPIFEDSAIKKMGHHMKYDAGVLRHHGVTLQNYYFDTMIASYLLNPGTRAHNLDALAFAELQHTMIPITDLIGVGKDQKPMADVPVEKLSYYSCEDADYTWRLYELFAPRLKETSVQKVFETIEMPLIEVLIEMEFNGVKLDLELLKELHAKVARKITLVEKKIYEMAGREFNISSPKQLKEILFDELHIEPQGLKKTKTGISTAASELEKMRGLHPIIDLISEYREVTKLQSTYIEALPSLVRKDTGRVHTSFNQTIAATGRLSSSDPNLQNIPIRTELGREIRKAFIADRGNRLISSDYSQVELRVIACLAKDEHMMSVFNRGEDIHAATASKIFDVPLHEVTSDQRRKAKEVNFGVLYGMGAWGLAQRTGISRDEARAFIDKYFSTFKDVKMYIDKMIETAKEKGYVETMFGRKRPLPEINSDVQMIRAGAERMAINMPIQGTAADLMKIAMIEVYKELKKVSPRSRLLLQVHDELVIECPKDEVMTVAKIVDEKMEKIHQMCVPIKVETDVGMNWEEMEEVA